MLNLNEPKYYAANGLSPLQAFKNGLISEEEYIGFLKGNIIKYTVRAGHKDSAVQDIDKCIDYCNHLKIHYLEKEEATVQDNSIRGIILKGADEDAA